LGRRRLARPPPRHATIATFVSRAETVAVASEHVGAVLMFRAVPTPKPDPRMEF
jgi:hypothetical protein